jgi:hypothetical protein
MRLNKKIKNSKKHKQCSDRRFQCLPTGPKYRAIKCFDKQIRDALFSGSAHESKQQLWVDDATGPNRSQIF